MEVVNVLVYGWILWYVRYDEWIVWKRVGWFLCSGKFIWRSGYIRMCRVRRRCG